MGEETQSVASAPLQVGPNAAEAASTPAGATGPITAELAASLPLAEVKRRLYEEGENSQPAATAPAQADTPGTGTNAEAVNPSLAGTERDPVSGQFVPKATQQQQATAETGQQQQSQRPPKTYASVDEAVRDIDGLRGNLNQAAESAKALQRRVQELEAAAARQQQEATQREAEANHRRFEDLVAQLPTQAARDQARDEYRQVLARQALGEYQQHLATQEQTLQQREFAIAKAQLPAVYQDIARFVADNNGVPQEDMLAIVNNERIANLINAAQSVEAVQSVSVALGELLDYEASRLAVQRAGTLQGRRDALAASHVPDVPTGVIPNAGAETDVERIKRFTPAEFIEYKRKLFIAAE